MSEHNTEKGTPACRGCGTVVLGDSPVPDHCGSCPPWTCEQCGNPCSMAESCGCWISLEGMALADLKALFATTDLSLTRVPPALSGGDL